MMMQRRSFLKALAITIAMPALDWTQRIAEVTHNNTAFQNSLNLEEWNKAWINAMQAMIDRVNDDVYKARVQ